MSKRETLPEVIDRLLFDQVVALLDNYDRQWFGDPDKEPPPLTGLGSR